MNDNELTVNLVLKTSEVDILINALDEKALKIYSLKDYIFQTTKKQVDDYWTTIKEEKEENNEG